MVGITPPLFNRVHECTVLQDQNTLIEQSHTQITSVTNNQ